MGAPLYILNYTKEEYIKMSSCRIGDEETGDMLSKVLELIESGEWETTDDIKVKNKSGDLKDREDYKYDSWTCVHECD